MHHFHFPLYFIIFVFLVLSLLNVCWRNTKDALLRPLFFGFCKSHASPIRNTMTQQPSTEVIFALNIEINRFKWNCYIWVSNFRLIAEVICTCRNSRPSNKHTPCYKRLIIDTLMKIRAALVIKMGMEQLYIPRKMKTASSSGTLRNTYHNGSYLLLSQKRKLRRLEIS